MELPSNELLPLISETGVNENTQNLLMERFTPFLLQAKEWREKAFALVVNDISQTDEMKMAREGRLAIRRVRLDADAVRKELKEDSNRYNKAVQGVYNMIEAICASIEDHLEQQEKFKELYEAKQKAELRTQREQECMPFREFMFANIDLSDLTEEDYERVKKMAQFEKQQAEEKAKQDELDRMAKEKKDEEERERLRIENERLKEEAQKREAELQKERDRLEAEQRKANIEAARIRKEAEQQAAAERAEKDRLQKELDDKKAAEAKAEADRIAAQEAELAKGDAQKFNDLLSRLQSVKTDFAFKSKKHKALHAAVSELVDKTITYAKSKL